MAYKFGAPTRPSHTNRLVREPYEITMDCTNSRSQLVYRLEQVRALRGARVDATAPDATPACKTPAQTPAARARAAPTPRPACQTRRPIGQRVQIPPTQRRAARPPAHALRGATQKRPRDHRGRRKADAAPIDRVSRARAAPRGRYWRAPNLAQELFRWLAIQCRVYSFAPHLRGPPAARGRASLRHAAIRQRAVPRRTGRRGGRGADFQRALGVGGDARPCVASTPNSSQG